MINNFSEPIGAESPVSYRVRLHPFIQNEFGLKRFNPFYKENLQAELTADKFQRDMREYEAYKHSPSDTTGQVASLNTQLGLGLSKDQQDIYLNGLDITGFVISLSISDSVLSPPYNTAQVILAMPTGLQNYIMQGYESEYLKAKEKSSIEDYEDKKYRAFTVFRQIKAGGWISIDMPVERSRGSQEAYTTVFLGKIGGFNYSSMVNESAVFEQTPLSINCEGFIQPLTQSQFRVMAGAKDMELLKETREKSAKKGGSQSLIESAPKKDYTYSVGPLGLGTTLSLTDWTRYIVYPLTQLTSQKVSLGVLFTKFIKFFAGMSLPTSVAKPHSDKYTSFTPRALSDYIYIAYSDRHFVGTAYENQKTPAPIASNLRALGGAAGKSGIWSFMMSTFVTDMATMECFTTMLQPEGATKEERDINVAALIRRLLKSAPHSTLVKRSPDFARTVAQLSERLESTLSSNRGDIILNATLSVLVLTQSIGQDDVDQFNEFDLDILQADVVLRSYQKLGAIPTIIFRLKPLCPGTLITAKRLSEQLLKSRPQSVHPARGYDVDSFITASEQLVQSTFGDALDISKLPDAIDEPELEPVSVNTLKGIQPEVDSAAVKQYQQEYTRKSQAALAAYDAKRRAYEANKLIRAVVDESVNFKYSDSSPRAINNFVVLDDNYLIGINFSYSEKNRINAVIFDSSFVSSNQTRFDLSSLDVVPDHVLDANDIRRDGLRVYEGSFPFLHNPKEEKATGDASKKILLLPQAMAERAFMLLANDHEYSSGSIQMVYHEGYDITPGKWGLLLLESTASNQQGAVTSEVSGDSITITASTGLDNNSYFEFYITDVSKNISIDQSTGAVFGNIIINYTRGSYGRKTNMFKYLNIKNSSTTIKEKVQELRKVPPQTK